MKGKVIYVDFTSKTKGITYAEAPNNKGFWARLLVGITRLFNSSGEHHKHRQDSYIFKRMV